MRLFIAVQFSRQVHQAILRAQETLLGDGTGQMTPPENLHLTLAFLGLTENIPAAVNALEQIQAHPLLLTVQGIGHFGNLYWAGVQKSPQLCALAESLHQKLIKNGFSLEDRDFIPHLTLCRHYRPGPSFNPKAVEEALGCTSCRIHKILLLESIPHRGRMIYREVFSRELL